MTMRATVLLGLLLASTSATPVEAHCEATGGVTCPLNAPIEALLEDLAAATGYQVTLVLAKDFGFHPPVATLRNGGSVLFLWADVEKAGAHTVTSSGTCGTQAADLAGCTPGAPGLCINSLVETGSDLGSLGDQYPLTVTYDAANERTARSRGLLSGTPIVGEPPLAEAFRPCPAGSSSNSAEAAVIPYHCLYHGGAATSPRTMRGALVVLA